MKNDSFVREQRSRIFFFEFTTVGNRLGFVLSLFSDFNTFVVRIKAQEEKK